MKTRIHAAVCCAFAPCLLYAVVFGSIRGTVRDPDKRPIPNAQVTLRATESDYSLRLLTKPDGSFAAVSVPVGEYRLEVVREGFATLSRKIVIVSESSPQLEFRLTVGATSQSMTVEDQALAVTADVITPTTVISRKEIQQTPGAALSNSLSMITNYVPGSWVTHDQLHVRGGHQVSWEIDGVPVPNTNIASNIGPQFDPKDIDYLQVQRGGYGAADGDRTYGVFDVVPRTGFERFNEGEVFATYGSFQQTNDQINFGSHSSKFAYFASLNGNRSEYGLETPDSSIDHDGVWGLGGMATLLYLPNPDNQLRFTATLRRDDYEIPGSQDKEHERDGIAALSWVHNFRPGLSLTTSPFYHYNQANYDGDPDTQPVSTKQHRESQYAGAQIALSGVTARHHADLGVYGFGQRDIESISLVSDDGALYQRNPGTGHLEALFLDDSYQPYSWLTLMAGARFTHFSGAISENAADPRLGGSVRLPYLHWVLRAYWGRYYQAPPLSTVSGPLLDFAVEQGLGFIPLRGERDEEHQFGLTIPIRGWSLEANNYHQRARNYFDHNTLGDSDVFFPLTINHARLYGWEVSIRSPQLFRRGEVYLAYAYAHAEGAGAVSGGLTDFSPPDAGYFLLDHDQRHTLHAGFNFALPHGITSGGNLYYGSGFTDGSLDYAAHLPAHVTFDLTIGKSFGERFTLSATALNLTNRRFLLDNSETFGGTHYADPRQIYGQVRYHFHY